MIEREEETFDIELEKRGDTWALVYVFEEGEEGGFVGEASSADPAELWSDSGNERERLEIENNPSRNWDDWDCGTAHMIAQKSAGAKMGENGFYWKKKSQAIKARKEIVETLSKGPLASTVKKAPIWAEEALAAGWTPPDEEA